MTEKIDPRVDLAFKKIFGVEENKDLLISLINSIVGKEDQVREVTLLNPYNPRNFKQDKLSILDIKAKGERGKRFNIEVQIGDEADYDKRALYYWAKLYTEQLKITEDYSLLSKAIGIHILNFTSIPSVDKYHNVFHITERESGVLYFKDLELHTIELKKFAQDPREELSAIISRIKDSLDIWVTFLTRHDLLNREQLPTAFNKPALKKALGVLDVMSLDENEREIYEGHLKWLRIEANTLKKYETKGFERGLEQGKAEGIQEGLARGLQKGKRELIRGMKEKRISLEIIQEISGLTEEEIHKLLNS